MQYRLYGVAATTRNYSAPDCGLQATGQAPNTSGHAGHSCVQCDAVLRRYAGIISPSSSDAAPRRHFMSRRFSCLLIAGVLGLLIHQGWSHLPVRGDTPKALEAPPPGKSLTDKD